MTFETPQALWLLFALPLLAGLYVLLQRRRVKAAVRYANLDVVRAALGPGARIRRHLPPFLLGLALAGLIVAMARPSAIITLPSEQRTIILAIDVSLSMRATDVEPSRLEAARSAAKSFIAEQPSDVRIGIVAFAGSASVVQKPTSDRRDLDEAIDRLQLQLHTAIGSGIIVSLAALFPEDAAELEAANTNGRPPRDVPRSSPIDRPKAEPKKEFKPVAPGSNRNFAIILLTDGRRTTGPDPVEAAKLAADRGVKVYTVGFGSSQGGTANADGMRTLRRETGTAIILITHDLGVIAEVADDVVVMYAGRIVERAPVAALFALPQHPYTIGLLGSIPRLHVEHDRLAVIEGQVPSPETPIAGCRFHPRCPFAIDRCRREEPTLLELGPEHAAACRFRSAMSLKRRNSCRRPASPIRASR